MMQMLQIPKRFGIDAMQTGSTCPQSRFDGMGKVAMDLASGTPLIRSVV